MAQRTAMEEAGAFLRYRMRTVSEMRDHLREKGYSQEETDGCISELKKLRYLDDYEYARAYTERGLEKGHASRRIARELEERGVPADEIRWAYEDIAEEKGLDEFRSALETGRRELAKIRSGYGLQPAEEGDEEADNQVDEKAVLKIGRKLARMGYSNSDVFQVMDILRRNGR